MRPGPWVASAADKIAGRWRDAMDRFDRLFHAVGLADVESPPRSRARDEIDPRYRWDLAPIFASWEEWETACDELGELVDRLARLQGTIAQGAEARSIEIRCELPDPPLRTMGDRRQLVSALYNLLENAAKYSDEGSVVTLRAVANGDDIDLEVSDHGVGIPARDLERVFERFYRVDRARSRETGGTGLGLSIVKHVAENHGGTVEVESEEGEGSTFTLAIPADRARRQQTSPAIPEMNGHAEPRAAGAPTGE